ncbi:hypothetical protein AM592_21410 [Bacillus gobiensis]|uniref:Uncharacterized protein n=1 Tax=Bacillus gobiensis TaxID=1441095 RepID=A0A0M5JHE8_9BACI|nr:hypothetical protein AM592_21410 [Bacillus gobiensis]
MQEPEQNTDVHSSMIIRRFIKELPENGYTVLVITSNLEEAISVTDEVYRMDETGIRKVNSGLENTNEIQDPEIEEMASHPLKLGASKNK